MACPGELPAGRAPRGKAETPGCVGKGKGFLQLLGQCDAPKFLVYLSGHYAAELMHGT